MTTTTAAAAAARALQPDSRPQSAESMSALQPQPEIRMATLWRRMGEIYGHRWTAAHGESVDAEGSSSGTWAKGLAGVTAQQLATGLEACIVRADPWPPTLPEFRALCFAIPSLLQVREDLRRVDAERMPFTLMVWRHLDSWAFAHAAQHDAERMLREAYADAREAVLRGQPLPIPPLKLEAHPPEPPKTATPSVVADHIASMKALFKGPETPTA